MITLSPSLALTSLTVRFPAAPQPTPTPTPTPAEGGISNPLEGITPRFTFNSEFNTVMTLVIASVWGLAIIAALVFFIIAWTRMSQSKNGNPHEVDTARRQMVWSGVALGGLFGLPAIIGLLIFIGTGGGLTA